MASLLQQTELIVFGYMRSSSSLFPIKSNPYYNIPYPVSSIVLSYLQNYFTNHGKHVFKIDDVKVVQKMLNAKCGEKFESKEFMMARLKWRLDIYPNGDKQELERFFVIHLNLLSLPSMVDKILFSRIYRIKENMTGTAWFEELSINEYDYFTNKCPLSELLNMNCKTLTIEIEIFIKKIFLKPTAKDTIISMDIINNDLLQKPTEITRKVHVEYKIEDNELEMVKKSECGKAMCWDIVDDILCIVLQPNGRMLKYAGLFGVYFCICNVPSYFSKIKARYTVKCIETNDVYDARDIFHSKHCMWGTFELMTLKTIQNLDSLTLVIDFQILDVFIDNDTDSNQIIIGDEKIIAYLLSSV